MRNEFVARMSGIYLIVDPEHTRGRDVVDIAGKAFEAGVAAVQLRDKLSPKGQIAKTAAEIQQLAREYNKLFIVNDHADIARIVDADGLHLGQKDLGVKDCRKVLDDRQIIGTSNALLSEAEESEKNGADYLAVGAIFPTKTKSDTRPAGLKILRAVRKASKAHIVAIGGINKGNLASVVQAGADSICVATAITEADDVSVASSELIEIFENSSSK